jgi:hypothetical protein
MAVNIMNVAQMKRNGTPLRRTKKALVIAINFDKEAIITHLPKISLSHVSVITSGKPRVVELLYDVFSRVEVPTSTELKHRPVFNLQIMAIITIFGATGAQGMRLNAILDG